MRYKTPHNRTLQRFFKRINKEIGYLKITELRPSHLSQLYSKLRKPEIRLNGSYAVAKSALFESFKQSGMLKKDVVAKAEIGDMTLRTAFAGERISIGVAQKISNVFGKPVDKLFNATYNKHPLSEKTIREHHSLIAMILGQAEKEMLIPYNPATKVINAPKQERSHQANYFEPE